MGRSIESSRRQVPGCWPRLAAILVLSAGLSGCGRAGGREAGAGAAEVGSRTPPAPTAPPGPSPAKARSPAAFAQRYTRLGTVIEVDVAPIAAPDDRPASLLRVGDDVAISVRISDATTGRPVTGARPAAWLAARADGEPRDAGSLTRKVAGLARGDPLAPPELDLNQFYVVALNDDATVTVVDPRFGFGGSRLLALVPLPGVGADWALSPDGHRLFVAVPTADRVVAIDTATWTSAGSAELPHPTRLALQDDGHLLWVASGRPGSGGGVAAVEAVTMRVASRLETGVGPHDLAMGRDDLRVYVTNRGSGTLTVVDARRQTRVADLAVGTEPVAVAFSPASGAAYVVDQRGGAVAVVAGDPPAVVKRVDVDSGPSSIGMAPGGRWALITRPGVNDVVVLDAATDRIVRRIGTEPGPDQVAFTDRVAYVRQGGSPMLRLIPIDGLTSAGRPASAIDVPIGRSAPGRCAVAARAVARASEEDAVLIANPADQAIYFYKEGLSAPQGSFRGYGHAPVAVLAVDRSLRPSGPGEYRTIARLRRPGRFDLAVFLDSPRIVHCFEVEIADAPGRPPRPPAIEARLVDVAPPAIVGRPARLRLRLEEQGSGRPIADRPDVRVLATLPGRWQRAFAAVAQADAGTYALDFTPPRAGLYALYVESQGPGLAPQSPWVLYLEVKEPSR